MQKLFTFFQQKILEFLRYKLNETLSYDVISSEQLGPDKDLHCLHYSIILTYCILVESSTVICWTSPFVISEVSCLFYSFCSIFDGQSC